MKQAIKALPILGPALSRWRLRYHYWKTDPLRLIRHELRGCPDASVVQIGSNDGCTGDPIHTLLIDNPGWKGLFVEPVPYVFARLVQNYGPQPRFKFENVAIGEVTGSRNFYYIGPDAPAALPGLPEWYDQLGSFDRNHILAHLGPAVEPFIVEVRIECVPLNELLARNGIEAIDLLHIDTEGYDWHVLRQLDLDRYSPRAILFEHRHLPADAKQAAIAFLAGRYRIHDHGADFVCLRRRHA